MSYFILAPLNLIVMVLCYLTNWFVCLFANELGELPGFLKYWQTWDDSCDVEFMVKEKVPEIFRYDFDKHYIPARETTPELAELGRDKGCVRFNQANPDAEKFTFKEKVQRYFCRVLWLTRNNGYGFAFYIFGKISKGTDIVIKKNINTPEKEFIVAYDRSKNILNRPWIVKISWPLGGPFMFDAFLGWKMCFEDTSEKKHLAMIANRFQISLK